MSKLAIKNWRPQKIVNGGKKGVAYAALDWAQGHNITYGGWCQKGHLARGGQLDLVYQFQATESAGYRRAVAQAEQVIE
jgi:hypothetical protein